MPRQIHSVRHWGRRRHLPVVVRRIGHSPPIRCTNRPYAAAAADGRVAAASRRNPQSRGPHDTMSLRTRRQLLHRHRLVQPLVEFRASRITAPRADNRARDRHAPRADEAAFVAHLGPHPGDGQALSRLHDCHAHELPLVEPRHFGTGWMRRCGSPRCGSLSLVLSLSVAADAAGVAQRVQAARPRASAPGARRSVRARCNHIYLRQNKALGAATSAATLIAADVGGSQVPVGGEAAADANAPYMGLDWFLLNVILYSAVFIPLERLFAQRPEQSTFRAAWRTIWPISSSRHSSSR